VPPEFTEAVAGLTATEFKVMVGVVVTVITVELDWVTSLRLALTKMPPVAGVFPAVKVTVVPVAGLIEPSLLLVRVHVKVTPEGGQEGLHIAVAVKA
jgi:hypothetical protein